MHQPTINPWVDYFQSSQFYIINQPKINPSYISAIYRFPECSRSFQNSKESKKYLLSHRIKYGSWLMHARGGFCSWFMAHGSWIIANSRTRVVLFIAHGSRLMVHGSCFDLVILESVYTMNQTTHPFWIGKLACMVTYCDESSKVDWKIRCLHVLCNK